MRDTPERDLAVAEDRLETADDRIRELEERIRTLESASEAALKYLKRVGTGELVEIEAENRVIEQLEGAIKQ